jgi:glutaredoxin 3
MINIISKDYCPYCTLAKELITSLWFEYNEIDVTDDTDKLREIVTISRMMTVPQIFAWEIKAENFLWGYSDIAKLHENGELVERLKK